MRRIPSIDIARGFVMIIMALDHTRDYLNLWSRTHSPLDLAVTTPIFFFTRWITHFCAPSFVFLSGVSAALFLTGSQDPRTARRWLLRRGLILIGVEFTLVNFALSFDPQFRLLLFEVIATIGAGLVLLSQLSRLPLKILLLLALLIVFGHDLLPPDRMAAEGGSAMAAVGRFISSLCLSPGSFQLNPQRLVVIAYPVLPWLGIMLTGFAAGRLFEKPAQERKKLFLWLGLTVLGLFVVFRAVNIYGDPVKWSVQKDTVFTLLSFLNVNKYPPSLLFTLVTAGGLLLVLSAAEQRDNRITRVLLVYGRAPLFYFIVHLYLIHLIMFIVAFSQGYHFHDLQFGPFQFGHPPTGDGLPLWAVYAIWIGVVIAMYPLCRWYGRYKATHPGKKWLRYF
jgi:uncharacterized membrane protein